MAMKYGKTRNFFSLFFLLGFSQSVNTISNVSIIFSFRSAVIEAVFVVIVQFTPVNA